MAAHDNRVHKIKISHFLEWMENVCYKNIPPIQQNTPVNLTGQFGKQKKN
jgi:hypothetical protein